MYKKTGPKLLRHFIHDSISPNFHTHFKHYLDVWVSAWSLMICLTFFCKWVFRFAQESKKFHQIIETLNKIVDLVEKNYTKFILKHLRATHTSWSFNSTIHFHFIPMNDSYFLHLKTFHTLIHIRIYSLFRTQLFCLLRLCFIPIYKLFGWWHSIVVSCKWFFMKLVA